MKKEILEKIRKELEGYKGKKDEALPILIQKYIEEIKEEESNHIYMYMGAYCIGRDGKLYFKDRNSQDFEFMMYRNLEQKKNRMIEKRHVKDFENKNMVLIPEEYAEEYSYEDEYGEKQREFFEQSIQTSQKEAKQQLIRRYKKKS